jgi:uncharacterized protein YlbG (UPF0298 family)
MINDCKTVTPDLEVLKCIKAIYVSAAKKIMFDFKKKKKETYTILL